MRHSSLLNVLVNALMAGGQDIQSIVGRIKNAVGKRGLPALAKRYHEAFAGKTRPRRQDVETFLLHDPGFPHIRSARSQTVPIRQRLSEPNVMLPVSAAASWPIPAITSSADLCAWLRVTSGELDWFADLKGLNRKQGMSKLGHYRYSIRPKRSGDLRVGDLRVIEAPKQRLKQIQRQILSEILDSIPPHAAAHGFVRGRSIQSFAAPHAGKRVVLRMDVRDFFPSIVAARVQAFFRTAGYPDSVSSLLCGLCTNAVPDGAWHEHRSQLGVERAFELRSLYHRQHLPQGAPTPPSLANLCAYRLDSRLQGLTRSVEATYTRYADDLAFSGGEAFDRQAERFSDQAGAIMLEEGFRPHFRKTRIMRQGVRQQLAGMIINRHLNIGRTEFDRMKAVLINCVRQGPGSQNRDGIADFRMYLNGWIGFAETVNSARGARLRTIFNQIHWEHGFSGEE
jgi:RNA-directed DNA polymerase